MQSPPAEGQGFTLADGMYIPDVFIRTIVVLIVFYAFSSFLLSLIRLLLNHKTRTKMIYMEYTAKEIEKTLNTENESRNYAVKRAILWLSAGIGFMLIGFRPFGWPSLGTFTFCLAIGYIAYFCYLQQTSRPELPKGL